jgi:voltage-gated potassium channel
VPETTAGRLAGVAMMITGIAVIGVFAGSLASLFGLDRPSGAEVDSTTGGAEPPVHDEPAALRAQLGAMEAELGRLADRARAEADQPPQRV